MYFAYIFDKTYENLEAFDNMINKCKQEQMAYLIFDPTELIFIDKNGKKVEYIENNVISAHNIKYKRENEYDSDLPLLYEKFLRILPYELKSKSYYNLNFYEIKKAIKLLNESQEFESHIENLEYYNSIVVIEKTKFNKERIYFRRDPNNCHVLMMHFSKTRNQYVHKFLDEKDEDSIENLEELKCFDEYIIKV